MPSEFVRIECPDCTNSQTIFKRASTDVYCYVCDKKIAEPTGGVAEIYAEIITTVDGG